LISPQWPQLRHHPVRRLQASIELGDLEDSPASSRHFVVSETQGHPPRDRATQLGKAPSLTPTLARS